jgi:hypothetical protein
MLAQFLGDGAATVGWVNELSLRQAVTPVGLRGRVNAGLNLLAQGVGPLGALVGGALGSLIGIRQTLAVAVLGGLVGLLWLARAPLGDYRELPATGGEE